MPTIVEFITARLDEDEATARACQHPTWTHDGASIVGEHPTDQVVDWVYDDGGWEHIARHDPARVLREVAAKRRLLAYLANLEALALADNLWNVDTYSPYELLALPYADHPDYDPSWSPA